jgi:hypothetical protein
MSKFPIIQFPVFFEQAEWRRIARFCLPRGRLRVGLALPLAKRCPDAGRDPSENRYAWRYAISKFTVIPLVRKSAGHAKKMNRGNEQ